jgi:hypothetical protein
MYWVTGILGLILVGAPWIFGYADTSAARWTSVLVGGATLVVSLIEAAKADRETWEYWAAGLLGLVAIVAPFVFGFSTYSNALWSSAGIGILITIFSGTKLFTGTHQTGKSQLT